MSFRQITPPRFSAIIAESGMGYPLLGTRETCLAPNVHLATDLPPHAPRLTPHDARTSGVRSCADPPPQATACHRPPNFQKPNGPDLDERPHYFSMSPNQVIHTDKIICSSPLAAAHPLTVPSWPRRSTPVCSGVPACRMAISRNACSLLDFPEFAQAVRYGVLASGKLWEGGRDLNSETFR